MKLVDLNLVGKTMLFFFSFPLLLFFTLQVSAIPGITVAPAVSIYGVHHFQVESTLRKKRCECKSQDLFIIVRTKLLITELLWKTLL